MDLEKLKSNFVFTNPSDKDLGVDAPSFFKDDLDYIKEVSLPDSSNLVPYEDNFKKILEGRRSVRSYDDKLITKRELSFILKYTAHCDKLAGPTMYRPVPSGGGLHPLDIYIAVLNVLDLEKGIYYYHPKKHTLQQVKKIENVREELVTACNNQSFVGNAAFVYIIASTGYRTYWKYGPMSEKLILLDSGHLGDHLMLVSGALNMGACPIGAYNQEYIDNLLELDGKKEMVTYIFPVGKRKK